MPIKNKGNFNLSDVVRLQIANDWPTAQVTSTSDIIEGTNQYFTNVRVLQVTNPRLTTANVIESVSNLYFTNARVNAVVQSFLTTANVIETSGNLYFTNARVVSALVAGDSITIEANGRISSIGGIDPNSNVEGNIRFTGSVTANSYVSTGVGVPTISSATNVNLSANGTNGGAVVITNSPLRLRSYTTANRGNITASRGDIIYNSTDNLPEYYT